MSKKKKCGSKSKKNSCLPPVLRFSLPVFLKLYPEYSSDIPQHLVLSCLASPESFSNFEVLLCEDSVTGARFVTGGFRPQ